MSEYVYCAVNNDGDIRTIGSNRYYRQHRIDRLRELIEHHNGMYPENQWRIQKFKLVPDNTPKITDDML